jgi:hypothetical protein
MSAVEDPVLHALDNPEDAPIFADAGDPGPMLGNDDGGSRPERPPFPRGGPVKCLGISSDLSGSMRCYYLDSIGQIVGLDAHNKHGKNGLIAMYGPHSLWLEACWPQWSKPVRELDKSTNKWVIVKESEVVGFDQAEASRAHIEECVRRGIFDPSGKLRGRGAHRTDHGNLLLHLGDKLLIPVETATGKLSKREYQDPGAHGGYVYPALARSSAPYHESVGAEAGQKILAQLNSWSYKRPLLDPMLLLGAIAASMLGGFLSWRPTMWIVGPRGTGKSTLDGEPSANEGFIGHLIGPARMNTADTSDAAIRQTLKNATIPVFIDELEPDAPKEKIDATVKLARVSAGGAKGHRGGQDQQAHEFTLRSPFWFSSILQPPLGGADASRIVTIELKKLEKGLVKPDFFKMGAADMGARLFRRVVDQSVRIDETIALYAAALSKRGLDARAQAVYGTLLGCADIALYDTLPDDELVSEWALRLDPARLVETAAATSDEQACLEHLLTSPVQMRGGDEREALGTWIGKAIAMAMQGGDEPKEARWIQQLGLKLVNAKVNELVDGPDMAKVPRWGATAYQPHAPGWLAIAWKHRGLDPLFEGTKWRGGVWRQQLARTVVDYAVEGADKGAGAAELGAIDGVKVKFDRIAANAVLVPLSAFVDAEDLPPSSKPEAVAEWLAKAVAA